MKNMEQNKIFGSFCLTHFVVEILPGEEQEQEQEEEDNEKKKNEEEKKKKY
jgi:hypothetical protein